MDPSAFFDKLDHPQFIVTTAVAGERSGCLVGFMTQCSIDPPRLLVCISEANHSHGLAREATTVAVHLVPRGAEALVRLFGSTTGDQVDKFDRCEWATGPGAVPLLAACPSRLVCRVMDRVAAGDHLARLVEVEDADAGPEPVFTLSMAKAMAVQPGHPA